MSDDILSVYAEAVKNPMWRGGGAVCGHTVDTAPRHYERSCGLCGHPIYWHAGWEILDPRTLQKKS